MGETMHFTKNISYKLKRLVPALGLAGAAAMMPGCDKSDEPIMPQTPPSTTPIEVELYFSVDNFNEIAGALLYRGPEPFYSLLECRLVAVDYYRPSSGLLPTKELTATDRGVNCYQRGI